MIRTAVGLVLFGALLAPLYSDDSLKEELWAAAKKGDAKAVQTLLDRGVDVNAKTAYGCTALWYAATKGHVEVVKILIQNKADFNVEDTFYHSSALSRAGNNLEVMKLLIEAGAKGADPILINAVRAKRLALVRAILEK